MHMMFEVEIVTGNSEKRLKNDLYELEVKGYHLYPIDKQVYIVKKSGEKPFGKAIINSVRWENEMTIIAYNLISLNTVN